MNPAGAERIRVRFIVSAEAEMSDLQREIYHSENGDRWFGAAPKYGRSSAPSRAGKRAAE